MSSTETSAATSATPIKRAAPTATKAATRPAPKALAPATPVASVAKSAGKPVAKKTGATASVKKSTPARTSSVKIAAKPAAKVDPTTVKPVKEKKPKLVRDSFTIPKAEYSVLSELKQRADKLASPAKKSELLRAGIKALAAMADKALLAALKAVPTIKTGRPAKA